MKDWKFGTRCVHVGEGRDPFRAHATPIYQTSTFFFESAEQAAAVFSGKEEGYRYIRSPPNSPTHLAFLDKIKSLENAGEAVAFSSGMAAETAIVLSHLKTGDHLLTTDVIYGGTYGLFASLLPRLGIEVSFVDTTDLEAVKAAMRPNTRLVFLESPANPTLAVCDIRAICSLAREAGAVSAVDNTFSTPYFQRPLELGSDLVVESCTKYIGGHGDLLGGVVAGSAEQMKPVRRTAVLTGGTMGTHEAWLCLRGLKTLHLRMKRHAYNAQQVAEFLEDHPKVEAVNYPGLSSHRQHQVAKGQMDGFGGMLSFELKGGLEAGRRLMNGVRLMTLAVSLGSVDTLIEHPASMTHLGVPRAEMEKGGITEGLVRISVGVEDVEDIVADLSQSLEKVRS
ncbi:MAG: aminotransferase class I/II-fold pyridoxal phosphate-dependent enzyme [Methanotrichaceae archaeon]|nr:aminotransferase class I/II-fold pyridoxal phosphate-dependent enzyme [Methanotrichaceae archaeon]